MPSSSWQGAWPTSEFLGPFIVELSFLWRTVSLTCCMGGLCPVMTSFTRLSRCFSRFAMLTVGFLRAAGEGKEHREARPFFSHWEQYGFCRSHFNFAWRQFVQLSCVRFLLWGACFEGDIDKRSTLLCAKSPVEPVESNVVSIMNVLRSEEMRFRDARST
jgi:hypothetical protein